MSSVVLKPRMSEKTYELSNNRVYVFNVDPSANKSQITSAVESNYDVTVINIRTTVMKGKTKRLYRNKRFETGRRPNIKKAYVTLKEGDAIPIFAAIEEQEEKEAKATERIEKAAEKQAKKDAKQTAKTTSKKPASRAPQAKTETKPAPKAPSGVGKLFRRKNPEA